MNTGIPLLAFSDLDGTLIDHDTYDWTAAGPALRALEAVGAGVVLASSKTAAEMIIWRRQLGLMQWPAIVENGAGVLPPGEVSEPQDQDYTAIRAALTTLPQRLRQSFYGFGDMTEDAVSQATGLDAQHARLAKMRAFSEPGLWRGSDADFDQFQAHLLQQGISIREGGRFLSLSFGRNKSDQMAAIIDTLRPAHTVALGDAPNDIEMLEAAEFGVVVANPHRTPLPVLEGEAQGRILRTTEAGPAGWNTAILDLLQRLNLKRD